MPTQLQTVSVARAILYVVAVALVVMECAAVGYRATSQWRDINRRAKDRATVALSTLEALHEQAMLNSRSGGSSDPAIATLDGAIARLSSENHDVRLWMSMGPQLVARPGFNAAQQTKTPEPELPRDRFDQDAIRKGQTATGVEDGWLRVARPSIMGVGSASHPRCANCHSNVKQGQVIGTYSVAVNLAKPKAHWRSRTMIEIVSASGIVLVVLGVIAALLNFTTLSPLRRLTEATRRLAAGNLAVKIGGTDRVDELGTLARSLEVFRTNLLDKLQAEEKIAHMAGHDALTGLANRTSLRRSLDTAVAKSPAGAKIAVVSIDLDTLKEINNQHGQSTGDEVLKAVADNISAMLREAEFVARVGGDDFVAVKRFGEQSELFEFVVRLKAALQEAGGLLGETSPGAHMGVAIWPDDATTTDALLAKADNALQRASLENPNSVCYYDAALEQSARRRRQLVSALADAAGRGELFLNYQVQKSLKSLNVTGYEALLRWRHPDLGLISPAEFIPLAEHCRSIIGIGEWVLRAACQDATRWRHPYKIAVNISPVQLACPDLPELVHDVLIETGLTPQRLELEITETAIIGDKTQALEALRRIKSLGVSIALDDFGRGYSSLETLRSFPFDKIKLDRFFVTELVTSAEARAIIRAIMALGRSLSIPVLAEGIETEDQLAVLRRERCDKGQGFLFGRPQPFADCSESERHAS